MRTLLVGLVVLLGGSGLIGAIFGDASPGNATSAGLISVGILILAYKIYNANSLKPSPKDLVAYFLYAIAYLIVAILVAAFFDPKVSRIYEVIVGIIIASLTAYGGYRVHRRKYLVISPEQKVKMQQQATEAGERLKEASRTAVEKMQVAIDRRLEEPAIELTPSAEKSMTTENEVANADSVQKEVQQEHIAHVHRKGDIIAYFEKYAELTRGRDWRGICTLNQINFDSFGTKKELRVLHQHLESDEVVFAITSGMMQQTVTSNSLDFGANTWLVVLTNERFLFLDSAMLTSSVDKQSIRFDKVQAVSSSQGLVLGKIIVDIGNRMVVIDNCQKATVAIISDLANKWLRELQRRGSMPVHAPTPTRQQPGERPIEALKGLAELFASGALTEDEFKAAKAKLLAQL